MDVAELVEAARAGRPHAVGRLISLVEDASPVLPEVMAALTPGTGQAHVVGITGPPGVGKSTVTSGLVGAFRSAGQRVGVLAVDPSSPYSGGALLGDRVRMIDHSLDPDVFIRSMATRGQLGGLARATPQALRVLDAAGCQVIIVETVGVGQSEVQVAALADTTVVLLAPGMGDGIQAAKAGILEVGDVFAVNQADRDGADRTARELRQVLAGSDPPAPGGWRPPVLRTVALHGQGLPELAQAIREHWAWLAGQGGLVERRSRRAAAELASLVVAAVHARMLGLPPGHGLADVAERVARGLMDPYAAVHELLADLDESGRSGTVG